ncbi:SO_0444 family Cu/Zn efflux transporter [Phocoenobacter skyensis]|uniref:SO_0444 family Cu/Zn efflux transporter n=1 Tax=Phocoenobacter skyensis TaxID=97481 RepID=A0A1H7XU01_9PAST|nr:SO_0444 family Cu/Zn efflux transporter [Pasteurella skyensis]MDP8078418.1 SO_0444 family Cu/Zn efflux transporter [Pasteurella skyensis]MDP8084490.1 SO_0444 family Cu/Zn efflux transporter [Pasteurella skyensis]MDP8170252.1 SO_0444 family Cu/Zn efflux transporter [Pasteurella skyensis]MDP8174364.1 SO_0444 family Cu/Zn efflux transporter [Pasteurella skyensis]MDP8184443.1 SO_0444 family Cu/Zn efflux transporter [Pasteurella skyensis]
MNTLTHFIQNFFMLVFESAPWLLMGFLLSGLIKVMVPSDFLHKHLGKKTTGSVVKGALIGAPLPLCSCSVIPVALGIRRAGASKASTTSFLIASPETGLDSIAITYALLGPLMTVIRPIATVTTAILTGLMVMFVEKKESETEKRVAEEHQDSHQHSESPCCSHKKVETTDCCSHQEAEQQKSCCSSEHKQSAVSPSFLSKVSRWFQFSFIDLINDTALWLLVGLIISAGIITWIPAEFLETWGSSSYAYLIMALIGVPMYICATSSTPLAVGLLFAGVSPGAILVFLLAGPATNIATLAIVKKELGKKVLAVYLSCLISLSFVFGWITDYLADFFHVGLEKQGMQAHSMQMTPLSVVCGLVLLLLMSYVLYFRKYLKKKS